MPRVLDPRKFFAMRIKEAREVAGVFQKQLGVLAEIDEFEASARINRYEQGFHEPDLQTAARLGKAAGIPLPYLYAEDDRLARLILTFSRLLRVEQEPPAVRRKWLKHLLGRAWIRCSYAARAVGVFDLRAGTFQHLRSALVNILGRIKRDSDDYL